MDTSGIDSKINEKSIFKMKGIIVTLSGLVIFTAYAMFASYIKNKYFIDDRGLLITSYNNDIGYDKTVCAWYSGFKYCHFLEFWVLHIKVFIIYAILNYAHDLYKKRYSHIIIYLSGLGVILALGFLPWLDSLYW